MDRNKYISPDNFNWKHIVENLRPGEDSIPQLQRLKVLQEVIPQLQNWAFHFSINGGNRLKESAATGVATLPMPIELNQALLVAKYTLWIFDLDAFIDKQIKYTIEKTLWSQFETLNNQINIILETITTKVAPDITDNPQAGHLAKAWLNLYQEIGKLEVNEFALENFSHQAVIMIQAMKREVEQNVFYQEGQKKETINLEQYLRNSANSIALHSVGALVATFTNVTELGWDSLNPFLETGAKIIRLANDVSSFWEEWEERKINSVSVELQINGFGPFAREPNKLQTAFQQIATIINKEITYFGSLLDNKRCENSQLVNWIINTTAFALYMYQDTNYSDLKRNY